MRFTHVSNPRAATFEIPRHECLDLVRSGPVGRICILERDIPISFPINYKVTDDGDIVMRTAPETAIGRYRGNASLEVDQIDLDDGRAWSVIVRGQLRPLLGEISPIDPEPLLQTGRTRWMILDGGEISGRRFVVHRAKDFAVEWQMEAT